MSAQPTPAEPPLHPRAARAQRYLQVLDLMVEIGVEILEELRPGDQPKPEAPTPTRADAYDRATRAIRRCMLLAEKFEQILAAPDRQVAARARIIRAVEDAIQNDEHTADTKEDLAAELQERLDTLDDIDDLEGRPVEEIITEICRDLGLGPKWGRSPWARRTPEDIADLHARAAQRTRPAPAAQPGDDEHDPYDSIVLRAANRARDG